MVWDSLDAHLRDLSMVYADGLKRIETESKGQGHN
jgi:hypothetical protein